MTERISKRTGKPVRKQTELQANSSRFNTQLMILAGAAAQLKGLARNYGLEKEYTQVYNLENMLHSRIINMRTKTNNDLKVKAEMKKMQAPTVLPNSPPASPLVGPVTQEEINRDWDEAIKANEYFDRWFKFGWGLEFSRIKLEQMFTDKENFDNV